MSSSSHTEQNAELEEEKNALSTGLDRIIDLQLLYLIYQGPVSGYDLRRIMQRRFHVSLSYGIIYPHLVRFEKRKLVTGVWGERNDRHSKKKLFTITERGKALLRKYLSELATMYEEIKD